MRYRENDKWIDLSQEEIDSRNNEKSSGGKKKKKKSSSHDSNACEVHQYSNRSSKKDLEEYGRTIGIELDRRKTKKSLLKQIKDFLAGN
jgi:hypothetical protein